jgi:hypothetical protein
MGSEAGIMNDEGNREYQVLICSSKKSQVAVIIHTPTWQSRSEACRAKTIPKEALQETPNLILLVLHLAIESSPHHRTS